MMELGAQQAEPEQQRISHLPDADEQRQEDKKNQCQRVAFGLQDADAFICHPRVLLHLTDAACTRLIDNLAGACSESRQSW